MWFVAASHADQVSRVKITYLTALGGGTVSRAWVRKDFIDLNSHSFCLLMNHKYHKYMIMLILLSAYVKQLHYTSAWQETTIYCIIFFFDQDSNG